MFDMDVFILILCVISLRPSIQHQGKCPETTSDKYNLTWLATTSRGLSQPLCIDKTKEIVYRKCHGSNWEEPEPECDSIQSAELPLCPPDFSLSQNDLISLCYKIIEDTPFPPECPFHGVVPFHEALTVPIPEDVKPIWMPIKRHTPFGLYEWIEASSLYKKEFEQYFVVGKMTDKACMLYYNESYQVIESCNNNHSAICAYKLLTNLNSSLCSSKDCRQSDFDPKSKCICVGYNNLNQSQYTKASFPKIYQNQVYAPLTSDTCSIGLEKIPNGTYTWSSTKQEIDYTYWSKDVVFNETNIYGALKSDGWILTDHHFDCFLYEEEPLHNLEPSLDLQFDDDSDTFTLTVTNPGALKMDNESNILLYCFTDAGSMSLIYRYDILSMPYNNESSISYTFQPHQYGPGHYWCEAFKYIDLEVIQSQKLFIKPQYFFAEFVAIFKIYYVKGTNPFRNELIGFLERVLYFTVDSADVMEKHNYTSRIMNVTDVDEENSTLTVNVHFTSRYQNSNDDDFESMKTSINEFINNLTDIKIEMVDFLSADYCPPVTVNCTSSDQNFTLTWPQTPIDTQANSTEICKCGSPVVRTCNGTFVDGARWGEFTCCQTFNYSSVTEELCKLTKENPSVNIIDDLYQISWKWSEFQPIDISLVADLLDESTFNGIKLNLTILGLILDNTMKVDQSIISEANTSDKIMNNINRILKAQIKHIQPEFVFYGANLAILVTSVQNISGIKLLNPSNDRLCVTVKYMFNGEDIDKLGTDPDVESAILFDSNINSSSVMLIVVYCKENFFFQEELTGFKFVSRIFGLILNSSDHFSGTVLYKNQSLDLTPTFCTLWEFPNWLKKDITGFKSPFYRCQFENSTNFALGAIRNKKATESLTNLLISENDTSVIINTLEDISKRYWELDYFDIYLIAKILQKISDVDDVDLAIFSRIISNLHQVERSILSKSQIEKDATDTILECIDTIIKNHQYQEQIKVTADNFMIVISDLKDTNFSGLVLKNINETVEAEIIEGDYETDVVSKWPNIYSAVVLSPELKNQMEEDTKIIMTVYLNDALFNEKNTKLSATVSKIFGVILPEIETYKAPISVLHKVTGNGHQMKCVHWQFNKTINTAGFWENDTDGENLSTMIHCPFWHTTNFALLILNDDRGDPLNILQWITNIGCALSMFGLLCIVLTAIFFKRWRMNTGNQILLNFVFALIIQIAVFYFSSMKELVGDDELACIIIGMILHYSIISEFCWMFVIAILQFKRFVEVLGGPPRYILLKACICGWILPLLPVSCVWFLTNDSYVSSKTGLCYPSGLGLYLGVWLPIAIIVAINLVIFIYIMYSVIHKKTECADIGSNEVIFQWRLGVLLFFMLGLSWTFGFLSELDFEFDVDFRYLFCSVAPLQGFIMYLFFIVFNNNTKYLYYNAFKKCCSKKNY